MEYIRVDRVKFVSELARQDLTLTVLSKKAEVSRQTLSYIKQGKRCTTEIGEKIAKALNVTVTELLEN